MTGHVVLWFFIVLALWRLSLLIWPYKKCGSCNATGWKEGLVGARRCGMCKGSPGGAGVVPRFTAKGWFR